MMAPQWWIDLPSSVRTAVSVPLVHCRLRILFFDKYHMSVSLSHLLLPLLTLIPLKKNLFLLSYYSYFLSLVLFTCTAVQCSQKIVRAPWLWTLQLFAVVNTCVWNGLLLWLSHKIWLHIRTGHWWSNIVNGCCQGLFSLRNHWVQISFRLEKK